MPTPPPPPQGMSGLYASLLNDNTISAAPISFNTTANTTNAAAAAAAATPKPLSSALRFQPLLKRPTAGTAKPKPAHAIHINKPAAPLTTKTTLEDWVGDEPETAYTAPPRANRKKRKKNRGTPPPPTNWDDVYDPMRPNSYEEYRDGEEKVRECREWRERLYAHLEAQSGSESEEERRDARFAPPPQQQARFNFAPPQQQQQQVKREEQQQQVKREEQQREMVVPDDRDGEDAFARRQRMSQLGAAGYSAIPPTQDALPPPPPPPPSAPTISAAPVRYDNAPAAPPRSPSPPPAVQNSRHTFASRLLAAQGWTAGQGLGRDGSGITTAIQLNRGKSGKGVFVDKNKRAKQGPVEGASEVVVLRGCVDGKRGVYDDGEIIQRVGDRYKRFGKVEQIIVRWDEEEGDGGDGGDGRGRGRVFVRFEDVGSAEMVVRGKQRVEVFDENETTAEFWDKERFEERDFEE